MERQKAKVHITTMLEEAIQVNGQMDIDMVLGEKMIPTDTTIKGIGRKIYEMARALLFGLQANDTKAIL